MTNRVGEYPKPVECPCPYCGHTKNEQFTVNVYSCEKCHKLFMKEDLPKGEKDAE